MYIVHILVLFLPGGILSKQQSSSNSSNTTNSSDSNNSRQKRFTDFYKPPAPPASQQIPSSNILNKVPARKPKGPGGNPLAEGLNVEYSGLRFRMLETPAGFS